MGIIKLKEPWCFNIGDLTEDEIEELSSHFVSKENYSYPWSHADTGSHVGIDWRGTSNYFGNIESFDEYDIEDNVAVYTIEELRNIIAEHLAKQPVEPESVTKFVVGKWYKWFQKDHGRTQKGKCATLYNSHFEMKPWICNSSEYVESGMFNLRDAESIEIIEDLSEIQDLLPDGHEDKWVKTAPKSERYLATMKFFEQLKEPERSEAIANYDEEYSIYIPKSLESALSSGFCWDNTEQESDYWEHIHGMLLDNTYFQEELLVFGKYKVGDIVVKTGRRDNDTAPRHQPGNIVEVHKRSESNLLCFDEHWQSNRDAHFRLATPEEVEAYNQGVRNVADIKPKDYKEAVHCTTQEEWNFVLSKFNPSELDNQDWQNYRETSYINTKEGTYGNTCSSICKDYTILTFKQWCEKYGHSYEVVPEYVECVETLRVGFTRGKIYTWPNPTYDDGDTACVKILNGHYWKFKPSTKEAYDKQQEKLKMEELLSEAKPTEIKPAKGMHVRCLKESTWNNGKAKIGQVFEIQDVSRFGDLRIENQSFVEGRLSNGEFELLPDYKEEPWVAQVGDWVYVLENCAYGGFLNKGEIVKCIKYDTISQQFKEEGCTWLRPKDYRKATQEEIDSVTKPLESRWPVTENVAWTEWTADNWYVEVSSQKEADAVIDAAAKMYGKKSDRGYVYSNEYCAVSLENNIRYRIEPKWFVEHRRKPRPITDFIQPEKKASIFEQLVEPMFDIDMAWHKLHAMSAKHKTQQDELVIYKPKQTRLVEPGAVSASASATNLIIKSNSKYL